MCVYVCLEEGVRDLVGMWIADRCVYVCLEEGVRDLVGMWIANRCVCVCVCVSCMKGY